MKETAERIVKQLNPVFVRHAVVIGGSPFSCITIDVQGENAWFDCIITIDKKGIWNGVRYVNEDRALALLKVHQEDWERAHPELVREMEWEEADDVYCEMQYAGFDISVWPDFMWTIWGRNKVENDFFGRGKSGESAKEDALTAFIDYLKKNP